MVFALPAKKPAPAVVAAANSAAPPAPPAAKGVTDLFPDSDRTDPDRKRSRRGRRDDDDRDSDRGRDRDFDRDDDDVPRPRRSKAKRSQKSAMPWILALCGAGLVLFIFCAGIIGVGIVVVLDRPANAAVVVKGAEFQQGGGVPVKGVRGPATKVTLANGAFTANSTINAQDPPDPKEPQFRCKMFELELQQGRTYTIDMTSNAFDAYLRLEDANGMQLMEDDDSGGNLNARMVFTPNRPGTYVIIATTYNPNAFGPFNLSIRESGGGFFKK